MQPRRKRTTSRRNGNTLFVFHTCYFVCLGPGSLLFIFVSIELFVVEISLVNERVSSIYKIPEMGIRGGPLAPLFWSSQLRIGSLQTCVPENNLRATPGMIV